MNDELLVLYSADRQERIEQPRMGTPEYTAMRERDQQRRLRAAAILSTLAARMQNAQPGMSRLWQALNARYHPESPAP